MSVLFRVMLILVSVGICIYITGKLKKGKANTHDMLFWVLFSGLLIIFGLFPQAADRLAGLLGIYTAENMFLLFIILTLLIRLLLLNVRSSQTEHRLRVLAEELAIREKMSEDSGKKHWSKPEMKLYICEDAAAAREEKSDLAL